MTTDTPRGGSRMDGPIWRGEDTSMGPAEAAVHRKQLREKLEAAMEACFEEWQRRIDDGVDHPSRRPFAQAWVALEDCTIILDREMEFPDILELNDSVDHATVLRCIDLAIELAEEESSCMTWYTKPYPFREEPRYMQPEFCSRCHLERGDCDCVVHDENAEYEVRHGAGEDCDQCEEEKRWA